MNNATRHTSLCNCKHQAGQMALLSDSLFPIVTYQVLQIR